MLYRNGSVLKFLFLQLDFNHFTDMPFINILTDIMKKVKTF